MKSRFVILAVLLLGLGALAWPLPVFGQDQPQEQDPEPANILPPGYYTDYFAHSRILQLRVSTNGPIELVWGTVNEIDGSVRSRMIGEATNRTNGRIIGRFDGPGEARGHLRGRVRDRGTNGVDVTGMFRVRSRDGEHVFVRRFHAVMR